MAQLSNSARRPCGNPPRGFIARHEAGGHQLEHVQGRYSYRRRQVRRAGDAKRLRLLRCPFLHVQLRRATFRRRFLHAQHDRPHSLSPPLSASPDISQAQTWWGALGLEPLNGIADAGESGCPGLAPLSSGSRSPGPVFEKGQTRGDAKYIPDTLARNTRPTSFSFSSLEASRACWAF